MIDDEVAPLYNGTGRLGIETRFVIGLAAAQEYLRTVG